MITEQNYVGKGNSANTPPQMAKNGPQQPPLPDSRQDELSTQTYQGLVKSLIEWTVNSKVFLKRRQHLSYTEKSKALAILTKQERLLKDYHSLYKPKANDLEYALKDEYQKQAEMNLYAQYFEFPPFPIPDSVDIYLPRPFDKIDVGIINNAYAGYMLLGDKLTCQLIDLPDLKEGDLIVVMHRKDRNHSRELTVGWFGKIEFGFLVLLFNHPGVEIKHKPIFIPSRRVVRFYKVTTLIRHLGDKKEVSYE